MEYIYIYIFGGGGWKNSCIFETMGNHCLLVFFAGESSFQGFLGGATIRPSKQPSTREGSVHQPLVPKVVPALRSIEGKLNKEAHVDSKQGACVGKSLQKQALCKSPFNMLACRFPTFVRQPPPPETSEKQRIRQSCAPLFPCACC